MPNYMQFCAIPLEVLLKTSRISVVLFVCLFLINFRHPCLLRFEEIRINPITVYFSGLLCAGWHEDTKMHKT